MKKLITALVVFVYSVPASLFAISYLILSEEAQDSASALIVPPLLMGAVCVLVAANVAGAAISVMRSKGLSFRTVMVFKLCLIPFYIVNFVCWALATMVFHIAIVVLPLIPFIIGYTYLTMLGTSAHVIAELFILRRSNAITAKQFRIHFILQIIFAADVFDSIYLSAKQKMLEAEQEQNA